MNESRFWLWTKHTPRLQKLVYGWTPTLPITCPLQSPFMPLNPHASWSKHQNLLVKNHVKPSICCLKRPCFLGFWTIPSMQSQHPDVPTTCQVAMLPAVACAAPDHRSRGAASASRLCGEAQPLRTSPTYEIASGNLLHNELENHHWFFVNFPIEFAWWIFPVRYVNVYQRVDGFLTMIVIPIMMVLNDVWLPYDGYSLLLNNDAFQWVIQWYLKKRTIMIGISYCNCYQMMSQNSYYDMVLNCCYQLLISIIKEIAIFFYRWINW